MAELPVLYTIEDAKVIFKCCESTIWKWCREGKFGELVRIGRRTYIRAAAVHKFTGGTE